MLHNCIVFLLGAGVTLAFKKKMGEQDKENDKYFVYYNLLNKWMKQKEKGILIAEKLRQRGIEEIAIYGMGDIAKHLQFELADTDVKVKYAIDQSELSVIDIDTYSLDGELPQVDAVIVTPLLEYESINSRLKQKMSCPIICMSDLIDGVDTSMKL